ncbi:uncharacterized protein LOC125584554 [Brassica napus]|uniref:uncharacterized protein LOC125584554 n=1 Tax=Brassica napus TaxID=3708 RepID=UPI00207865BC|nr:uncharacterized protein LOC125584554 [Brassica napus]
MKDGVLRMIVSRVKVKDHDNKCTHFLPPNTAAEDHRFVVKGCKRSTSRRRRGDGGGSCVSFDLPGVCSDDILVLPNENEVKFYGENKEVYEHDDSCRIFMGAITRSSVCAPGVPL